MNIDTAKSHGHLVVPHGGELVDLKLNQENAAELKARSKDFPSWDLTSRQIRDLELLLSGGFSPLRGFMNRDEYERVCQEMRLSNGLFWPMPITLDVPDAFAKSLKPGSSKVALRDSEGVMLAVLYVEDVWQPDRKAEAQAVFGTTITISGLFDLHHRTCARSSSTWGGARSSASRRAIRCIAHTSN